MYVISFPEQSNRASWVFVGMITDLDDNPIDLSLCKLVFSIRDKNGVQHTASTDNGKLTIIDIGTFRWFFTLEEMHGLCPGQCQTGFTMWNDDRSQTVQLSIGPLNIVDGVVP
jgi:hypothetical protein